jgi:hypothetical protein
VTVLFPLSVAGLSAGICPTSSPTNTEGIVMSASGCFVICFSDRSTDISGGAGACCVGEQPEQERSFQC